MAPKEKPRSEKAPHHILVTMPKDLRDGLDILRHQEEIDGEPVPKSAMIRRLVRTHPRMRAVLEANQRAASPHTRGGTRCPKTTQPKTSP